MTDSSVDAVSRDAGSTAWPDDAPARPFEAARLQVINDAARALLNAREPETLLRIVHAAATRFVAHDILYIGLFREPPGGLRIEYYVEAGQRYPPIEYDVLPPLAQSLSERLEPLLLATRQEIESHSQGRVARLGDTARPAQSAVFVPLINDERVLGVLTLQSYREHAFTARDADLLQLLGHQTAAAIENARLWRSLHDSVSAHRTLVETARALHTAFDEPDVAKVVARELRRVVPCNRSLTIFLLDPSHQWLEPIYADGALAAIDHRQNRLGRDEGLSGYVLRTRRPFICRHDDQPPFARPIVGRSGVAPATVLALPLLGHRRPVGTMVLTRGPDEPPFTEREADLAMLFADQTATAIENARLYQAARAQAEIDALTGLLNHRAFHQALDHHLKLAHRGNRPLAVLMLDLDRFKALNDTYGHLTGDVVLQFVGTVLRSTCRETDIPARYGGEEFVVILPDTDEAGALTIAERIRVALAEPGFERPGLPALAVRVSGGVAVAPVDGADAHTVLALADQRLYSSKRAGGNTITGRTDDLRRAVRPPTVELVIEGLLSALEPADQSRGEHARRVVDLALATAEELGVTEDLRAAIRLAGHLLDIGAVGVPGDLPAQPRVLTEAESALMREHPIVGAALLQGVSYLHQVQGAVRSHHERWDGRGYPDGLRGEAIPLLGRLFAAVDSYVAMTESRPYRPALDTVSARAELAAGVGTHYDPAIIAALLRVVDRAARDHASG